MVERAKTTIETFQPLTFEPLAPWSGNLPPHKAFYNTYIKVKQGTGEKYCNILYKETEGNGEMPLLKFFDVHGFTQTAPLISLSPFPSADGVADLIQATILLTREQVWAIDPKTTGPLTTNHLSY